MEDYVTLRVRTGKDEYFQQDSRVHVISSKKGAHVDRFSADLAISQNALQWNPGTGGVVEAKIYVEEDVDTPAGLPSTPLKAEEIAAFKNTDGLGDDSILVNGKIVKKTTIDFKNKYEKVDFKENNIA